MQSAAPGVDAGSPTVRLYRGETSLPRDLLPVSPLVQLLMRRGAPLEEAVNVGNEAVAAYDVELISEVASPSLSDLSGFYQVWSPFVSTTKSLRRALDYASAFRTDFDSGYLNVLQVRAERAYDLEGDVDHRIARLDQECLVGSFVAADEIVGQIPLARLATVLPPGQWLDEQMLSKVEEDLLEHCEPFAPSERPPGTCPSCEGPLEPWVDSWFGGVARLVRVDPPPPKLSGGGSHALELDILAQKGLACRCGTCACWFVDASTIGPPPVVVRGVQPRWDALYVTVESRTPEPIWTIVFTVSLPDGSSELRAWRPVERMSEPADWPYVREAEVREIRLDHPSDASGLAPDVRVDGVTFLAGKGWVRIESETLRTQIARTMPGSRQPTKRGP